MFQYCFNKINLKMSKYNFLFASNKLTYSLKPRSSNINILQRTLTNECNNILGEK